MRQLRILGLPTILEESPTEGKPSTITKRFALLDVLSDEKPSQQFAHSSKEETKND